MNEAAWIIEPRDSLIVRDGKPFGANIAHATSLDFPFPSTTAGGVRTRAGLDANGRFQVSQIPFVKEIAVKGALLASLNSNGEIAAFYLPSPADALLLQTDLQKSVGKVFNLKRLFPIEHGEAITNLPKNLLLLGTKQDISKQKPYTELKYWKWDKLKDWLNEGVENDRQEINVYGIKNLLKDSRVHVGINEFFGSDEGNLFQTRGLEFNYGNDLTAKKLALVVFTDEQKANLPNGIAPFGGERRLVNWRKAENLETDLTTCPDEIREKIIETGHCRLMLLTPAYFENGLMPQKNDDFEVKAIACNRYQTVSGWDFVIGKPKPTQRLLPAGSILFLKLKTHNIADWIDKTWFSCLSETDSDGKDFSKDGFGLSILGTWNPYEDKGADVK
ncbi:MAG: type III-B CRISPR module-associated protein Cmr3 [Pyrinomonadaceae bacterium]